MDRRNWVWETYHTGEWQIAAQSETLTIRSGEVGHVVFRITNVGSGPRLALLEIETDPGAAHASWFSVEAPAIVPPGRTIEVAVQVEPRVAALEHDEQYTFSFRGRIDTVTGGDVTVTVRGPERWQVSVSPRLLEVTSPGRHLVVYTVTNLLADTATAVLEVPDPDQLIYEGTRFQLDEAQRTIPGLTSAAFTLTVDFDYLPTFEALATVHGRISSAGDDDYVPCEPFDIRYPSPVLKVYRSPDEKLIEPDW